MVAVFVVLAGLAGIWSGAKYHIVYNAVIDSFPPQFQDPYTSRYALPVLALSHPTRLSVQLDYVKSEFAGVRDGLEYFIGILFDPSMDRRLRYSNPLFDWDLVDVRFLEDVQDKLQPC